VVALETKVDVRLIIASMYFDINRPIDIDLQKMEATLAHAKGVGIIFAMDSNSRSTSWHDVLTNKKGKILVEFLMSKQLHIVNEESCCTTFWTSRGASNIDYQALDVINAWVICDKEGCSDHSILKYGFGNGTSRLTDTNLEGVRYKVTQRDIKKFQGNLIQIMQQHFCRTNNVVGGAEELDGILCLRVATSPNMDVVVEELHDVLELACRRSFRILRTTEKALQHKSVPWWTEGLI